MFSLQWTPGITLEHLERHAIEQAFKFYKGNKTQIARALDIAVRTLDTKLEKYEADDKKSNDLIEQRRSEREEFDRRQRGINTEASTLAASNGFAPRPGREDDQPGQERQRTMGEAESRPHVESASKSITQPAVPVSVGKKVQDVLPAQASVSGARKGR